ncbi:hypothetical protein [Chishuiella sp.]|uniref:hypothetical protein n=1 Tax=Chishuiella sp. TaxID=1969467 RepID=UPI0028AA1992|nr:hypothetical protein [Chishuiella sp.]
MKNIKLKLSSFFETAEKKWQLLSLEKQHQVLLTFLLSYGLLSLSVFIKIGYDLYTSNKKFQIEHIKTPIQKSSEISVFTDTINSIQKNNLYERE